MSDDIRYNLPDKDDPEYRGKVVDLLRTLFDQTGGDKKNFIPVKNPDENLQVGDVWYNSEDNKMRVNTPDGVKIIKYE